MGNNLSMVVQKRARGIQIFLVLLAFLHAVPSRPFPYDTTKKVLRVLFANPANGVDCLYIMLCHYMLARDLVREHAKYASNIPEKVIKLVNQLARERGLKYPITCVQDEKVSDFMMHSGSWTMFVNPRELDKLVALVDMQERNETFTPAQETLYYHYIATIHHEINHIRQRSYIIRVLVPWLVHHACFAHMNTYWNSWGGFLKHGTVLGIHYLTCLLCAKYDEFKAEANIPCEKKLLEAQLQLHLNNCKILQGSLDYVDKVYADTPEAERTLALKVVAFLFQRKRFDRWPLLYELLEHTHPSGIMMAAHVQNQLAKLEK